MIRIALNTQSASTVAIVLTITQLPTVSARDRADVLVAVTEDNLRTDVKRGENRGCALTHAAVVRRMSTVKEGATSGGVYRTDVTIDDDWQRDRLKVVAFVQERRSRRVLATASVPITRRY
jgi:hypothetical protein